MEAPAKIDGVVGQNLDLEGLLQDVSGAIADQTQVIANMQAETPTSAAKPMTQFMAPTSIESNFWSSGKKSGPNNNPHQNQISSFAGTRRHNTASDGAGMELILELLQVMEDASSSFFSRRKAGKISPTTRPGLHTAQPISKMMAPKKSSTSKPSLLSGTSLSSGGKKSLGANATAQEMAEARLEGLLDLQFQLMNAMDKKYAPLSTEQKQRIEDGVGVIRSDLYKELGQGGHASERMFKHVADDAHKPNQPQAGM